MKVSRVTSIASIASLLSGVVAVVTMASNITAQPSVQLASDAPGCANRCMVDSIYVTQCLDVQCLCHGKEYQQSLLQCLYSQCDPADYGQALASTIHLCIEAGAIIHMVAPNHFSGELLRSREDAYLDGREVLAIPGLKLRQESVEPDAQQTATVTLTVLSPAEASLLTVTQTATATTTIKLAPTLADVFSPSLRMLNDSDAEPSIENDTPYLPWLVTTAGAQSHQPSFVSFVV